MSVAGFGTSSHRGQDEIGCPKIKDCGEIIQGPTQVPMAKGKATMARAREVVEGVFRSEGGRGQQPPLSLASNPLVAAPLVNPVQDMSLQAAIASNVAQAVTPQYLGVGQCLGA